MGGPARGKIRYIGGYTIAKLKFRNSRIIQNSLYVKGKEDTLKVAKTKAELFDLITTTYSEISKNTSDIQSLQETQRKQNLLEGLCNIDDETFNFFLQLERQCRELLCYENLQEKKSEFFIYVKKNMLENEDHKKSLIKLFSNFVTDEHGVSIECFCPEDCNACSILKTIFKDVISLFVKVSVAQFRKDLLSFLKTEKTKALRKKVMKKGQQKTKQLNMDQLLDDDSENKVVSHLLFKSEFIQGTEKINSTFIKKTATDCL